VVVVFAMLKRRSRAVSRKGWTLGVGSTSQRLEILLSCFTFACALHPRLICRSLSMCRPPCRNICR